MRQYIMTSTPFSEIPALMQSQGLECTYNDVLFVTSQLVKLGYLTDLHVLHNDLGYWSIQPFGAYPPSVIEYCQEFTEQMDRDFPSIRPSTVQHTLREDYAASEKERSAMSNEQAYSEGDSGSGSDMDVTWDFSEIYSLLGFMGTLILSMACAVLIEYVKAIFDSKTNTDQTNDQDKKEDDTTEQ